MARAQGPTWWGGRSQAIVLTARTHGCRRTRARHPTCHGMVSGAPPPNGRAPSRSSCMGDAVCACVHRDVRRLAACALQDHRLPHAARTSCHTQRTQRATPPAALGAFPASHPAGRVLACWDQ
eukprot:354206-Chlamydomonas_euryale.AAC.10